MPTYDAGTTGLTGTVGVTILDAAGAVHVARTTAGITELVAGSGSYSVAEHDAAATLTYVWDNGVGTVGACETLYAGRENLALIGTGSATVVSPITPTGTITIYAGDDYASADSRAIAILVADSTHALGLDGQTVVVRIKSMQATWTASSVAITTAGYTVTFQLTQAQTAALTMERSSYELEATLANGHVVTLTKGTLLVVKDIALIP